jgi:octaprenyl-diphosphate synthase
MSAAAVMRDQVRSLVGGKVDALEAALVDNLVDCPEILTRAAGNVLSSGGKRLRPYLHLLSADLCGYEGRLDVQLAAVFEYVHVASLLHDDVIDEAVLRRGMPTLNAKFGNTLTVLVGDYLCMKAQALALEHGDRDVLGLVLQTTIDLVAGETLQEHAKKRIDLSLHEYLQIVDLKTGRLMAASCESASLLAGDSRESERARKLREYGSLLGTAFQLTDDILDFEADEDTLGKPVLADLREGTLTLPALHALEVGGAEARRLIGCVVEDGGFDRVTVAEVQDLVRETGGLAEAKDRARDAANAARDLLEPFPDGLSKQALAFATEFAIGRAF